MESSHCVVWLGASNCVFVLPVIVMYMMSFLTLPIFWVGQQMKLRDLACSNRSVAWIHIVFLFAVTITAGFDKVVGGVPRLPHCSLLLSEPSAPRDRRCTSAGCVPKRSRERPNAQRCPRCHQTSRRNRTGRAEQNRTFIAHLESEPG